ncbi:metallophosphoesterase [Aequorivita sp. H23M31]|uniref:Metallophosphoesterase n=1 Tax=Aequorivita ciconiae TaxID=2494375 RepID=A0A410FZV4_9FLAO|nr:metallophosphoesterase [Aequorivita sp. H23M31]QAA80547.1 metallophosphoesterase [Aequorivita sp. H23M31]
MIRILHLTDFHLNRRTLRDWNDFYKDSFFEKLDQFQNDRPIDLVVFTGDLIDKGGKDFSKANLAFEEFNENIIKPIIHFLKLDISKFIICPGNHDINRSADDEIDENGLKSTLTSSEKIIDFIGNAEKTNSYKRIERIRDYKIFESKLYENIIEDKIQSLFTFSIKFTLGNRTIGISSINSSWRCYGEDDFNNIIIGETQLNNNFKFISDCDIKIALIHHQLDWLIKAEKKTMISHVNKNYDLVLSGHVHEGASNMSTGFTGSVFHNVSSSGLNQIRTNNIDYVNGFTIIDYNENITCYYLKYNHNQKIFVDNTDLVDKGKKIYGRPVADTEVNIENYRTAIENIIEDHYLEMNNHFITGKRNDKDITVKNAFIYPPIDNGKSFYEQKITETNFGDIINSNENILFLGPQESGKKSLLFRIIVEFIDDYDIYFKIPVFIDFNEIKNKEFTTIIKEYTRLGSDIVREILKKGKFIFVIDNLSYHESKNYGAQINRLHKFYRDFPKNRFICSYIHDNLGIIPPEIINYSIIPFSYHFIRGLKTKEIKQIMKQWLPYDNSSKNDENLEKLVKTFTSYHLPPNALSVHLYLWCHENSQEKPINQAVLMEIYIDLILEKLNKENIYRKNFDSKNKIQLISMIAEKIIRKEDNLYTLEYTEFHSIIHEYLKEKVGFTFDEDVIINYLLERKIFTKNNRNEVRFSQVCFIHFFVAKRMQDNTEFKKFILDETRYFNYPKEIDYYTGLVRSDIDTFRLIFQRFKEVFDPMNFILTDINPDEYFNIPIKKNTQYSEPLARNIEIAKIKENRPTNEISERQLDEQLNRISHNKNENKDNKKIDFDRMMLIMCNVLRNSEGIEDLDLKKSAYNEIIKHNITYTILYTQLLIKYIIEHRKLPPSIPENISLDYLLQNFPYLIQQSLNSHLGTQKLEVVILDKILQEKKGISNTKSEIEKYLSIALFSDIQGNNFNIHLKYLVKSANTVPVQNFLLYKLTEYLYKRSKGGSENEAMYLDLISDLKIRTQKLPKRLKERIVKDLLESKNKMKKYILLE